MRGEVRGEGEVATTEVQAHNTIKNTVKLEPTVETIPTPTRPTTTSTNTPATTASTAPPPLPFFPSANLPLPYTKAPWFPLRIPLHTTTTLHSTTTTDTTVWADARPPVDRLSHLRLLLLGFLHSHVEGTLLA